MKKLLAIVVVCFCACAVFAGPHHGRGPAPRGHYHHHSGHHGSDGVWLAAGITSIVANGLHIINDVAAPRRTVVVPATPTVVTTPAPVYTEPVYYPQPRYVAPAPAVYYPPAPVYTRPVYRYPAPQRVIIYDNGCGAPRYHNYGW